MQPSYDEQMPPGLVRAVSAFGAEQHDDGPGGAFKCGLCDRAYPQLSDLVRCVAPCVIRFVDDVFVFFSFRRLWFAIVSVFSVLFDRSFRSL